MDFYDYCNNGCNFRDSRTYKDVIKGVQKYEPDTSILHGYRPIIYSRYSGYYTIRINECPYS